MCTKTYHRSVPLLWNPSFRSNASDGAAGRLPGCLHSDLSPQVGDQWCWISRADKDGLMVNCAWRVIARANKRVIDIIEPSSAVEGPCILCLWHCEPCAVLCGFALPLLNVIWSFGGERRGLSIPFSLARNRRRETEAGSAAQSQSRTRPKAVQTVWRRDPKTWPTASGSDWGSDATVVSLHLGPSSVTITWALVWKDAEDGAWLRDWEEIYTLSDHLKHQCYS